MYELNMDTILKLVPRKEISRFKALLSGRKSLEVIDSRSEDWTYYEGWDFIVYDQSKKYCGVATEFKNNLSDKMFIYNDLVLFIEHKGPSGWCHPKVTLLSLSKGLISFNYDKK